MRNLKKLISVIIVLTMVLGTVNSSYVSRNVSAASKLPADIYLAQEQNDTCTLSSATMMLRARMYLSNNSQWSSITESAIRSVAWGNGLKWSWKYTIGGNTINVAHSSVSGISLSKIKSILDSHPEGIVLYDGNTPHAVFVTDYEGDTIYCADPATNYSKKRIPIASSWLGKKRGSQSNILNNTTAYWYVSSYSITGSSTPTVNTKLTVTQSASDSIKCAWDAVSGAEQYFLEIKDSSGIRKDSVWTKYQDWTFNNLPMGTYTVRLDVLNDNGNSIGEISRIITIVLMAPDNVNVQSKDGNSVVVEWSVVSNAYQYFLELLDRDNRQISYIYTEYTDWTFNNLSEGEYTICICSTSRDGKTSEKKSIPVTVDAELVAPENFKVWNEKNNVFLSWDKVETAYQYFIEVIDSAGKEVDSVWTSYSEFSFLNLNENIYTIKISSTSKEGDYSNKIIKNITISHCWDSGTITKAATHTSKGEKLYKCSICGTSRIELIDVIEQGIHGQQVSNNNANNIDNKNDINVNETIVKKAAKKSSATKLKVVLKKVQNVTGYEIKISTSKKFKKNKTVSKQSTNNSITFKKLKKNKKYFVKARCYKIVNGKKYYSDWTTTKKVNRVITIGKTEFYL